MQSYAMEHFNEAAKEAEKAMRGVFERTPLQKNEHLSAIYGADIWLKREDLSPVRSYKLRGAFNAMRKQDKNKLFVGGDAIQIELVGDYFDDSLKAAQGFCNENNGHFLSPFDDADVIEGQASVAVEIEAQLGFCPDHIVMPVGGGGLSAGVLNYFKNSAQYSLIEPLGGASLWAALIAGRPVPLDKVDTFADGAAVGQIGNKPFETLKSIGLANVLRAPED